ncbi:mCG144756, partial [Mus musculus]
LHGNGFVFLLIQPGACVCPSAQHVCMRVLSTRVAKSAGNCLSNSVAQSTLKFPAKYLISFKCVLLSRFCDHWFLYPDLSGIL